jgi:hypothetical protein
MLEVDPEAVLQLPAGHIEADGTAAVLQDPARALGRAAPDLEYASSGDVAQGVYVVLPDTLGAPQEAAVAQEVAVRGLVLVGVRVPVGPVGAKRLGLVGRPTLGTDAMRHGRNVSTATGAVVPAGKCRWARLASGAWSSAHPAGLAESRDQRLRECRSPLS